MKKITFLSALVGIIMLFALNANADTLDGVATDDALFAPVGNFVAGKYEYFIPLGENTDPEAFPAVFQDGIYGVDAGGTYGTSFDRITLVEDEEIYGPLLTMYFHFNIAAGDIGTSITIWNDDLDLIAANDPEGFFEEITVYGGGGMPNDTFTTWQDLEDEPDVTVDIDDPFSDDSVGIKFSNLNITGDSAGDFWLQVGFRSYSIGFDADNGDGGADGDTKTWKNTVELISVSMETAAAPVPEPATIALLGIGLAGLAGGAAMRKWKKKVVDKS